MEEKSFVHLHCHTEYSLLDGLAKIEDFVSKAKSLGMKSLAITDHGNMYGVLKFYKECKKQEIKPIIGCEIYVTNDDYSHGEPSKKTRDNYHLILLAKDETGYHNLIRIVSEATERMYYKPRATKESLKKYNQGLIALSACVAGEVARSITSDGIEKGKQVIQEYIDIFGRDNYYLEIQEHNLPEEKVYKDIIALAEEMNIPLVATNDVHYIEKKDAETQDILFSIQAKTVQTNNNRMKMTTPECYFKSQEEMYALFGNRNNCLSNTEEIAERCNVEIKFKQKLAPKFPGLPEGETETSYLRQICENNLPIKYPYKEVTLEQAKERMYYELKVISDMGFSGYFLIVADFIHWAENNNIMIGPGRGSGAGSIVCYLTGITKLEPIGLNLLFERFLNPERVSMPDIDTDIMDSGRDAVAEYMMKRYKYENSAKIVTYQTMAAKSAVRNVAKVLGLSFKEGSDIADFIADGYSIDEALEQNAAFKTEYEKKTKTKQVIDIAKAIEGLPRQHGSHAAGIVISEIPLKDVLPVSLEKNIKTEQLERVTEFDKDEVEQLGLLKMDLLGLINLSIITECINYVGKDIDLSYVNIPLDDKKAMDMLKQGNTFGVFQLESAGMTELVKKLAPENYFDMIPLVALYRPGPLGSGMVDDFVECRHGRKEITYLHPWLEPILKETYGVILYQEQVMQIVQRLGNFTLGEADIMRRAMGHKEPELLKAQEQKFVDGCISNNIDEELSRKIFNLMLQFASYGFNKSHSAAYAFVAYQTAYLKAHYPVEYMAAYLSHCKREKLPVAKATLNKMRIKILPLDINKSDVSFIPEEKNIRIGFSSIKGVGEAVAKDIVEERKNGQYLTPADFLDRVDVGEAVFVALCKLNAFGHIYDEPRRLCAYSSEIYKEAKKITKSRKKADANDIAISLFGEDELLECLSKMPTTDDLFPPDAKKFKEKEIDRKTFMNYELDYLGFYASFHPLDRYRDTHIYKVSTDLAWTKKAVEENRWNKKWDFVLCAVLEEIKAITIQKQGVNEGRTMAFAKFTNYQGENIDAVIFPKVLESMEPNKTVYFLHAKPEIRDGKFQLIVNKIEALE